MQFWASTEGLGTYYPPQIRGDYYTKIRTDCIIYNLPLTLLSRGCLWTTRHLGSPELQWRWLRKVEVSLKNPQRQKHAGEALVGWRTLQQSKACPGISISLVCFFVKFQTQKRPKNHPISRWYNLNPESIFQKTYMGQGFPRIYPKQHKNEFKSTLGHSPTCRYHFLLLFLPSETSTADPAWRDICSKGPSHAICIPSLWVSGIVYWLHSNCCAFAN